jgi:hypothetical protein
MQEGSIEAKGRKGLFFLVYGYSDMCAKVKFT